MYVLGISAYYHDSAVSLIKNGIVIAAASEERFTRLKNDERFPHYALDYVLHEAKISLVDLDAIVFYEKPMLKFERALETFLAHAPRGFASFRYGVPKILEKFFFRRRLLTEINKHAIDGHKVNNHKLFFSTHHLSHAASAYYPSPFDKALVFTCDGVGEWTTTGVFLGDGQKLLPLREIHFPHSLGLLYSTFTAILGFKVNEGEYKVMGLAPYGMPTYLELMRKELVKVAPDGSFKLNLRYFNYTRSEEMFSPHLLQFLGLTSARRSTDPLTQQHMDIAASLQRLLEEVLLIVLKGLKERYQLDHLCLAGGVALNCVANGLIERSGLFNSIWIQPAAGDAGGSLGAALAYYHLHTNAPRVYSFPDGMQGARLGPSFSSEHIQSALASHPQQSRFKVIKPANETELLEQTLEWLLNQKTVAWFQGRMEFGPRALGGRSILADPRSPEMQRTLNLKIKYRESFRPFAPMVLEEDAGDWFEDYRPSPYMLKVYKVKKEHHLELSAAEEQLQGLELLRRRHTRAAAISHIDYSARVQGLSKRDNPRLYQLIKLFKDKTGLPMLVNTSFNLKDEPIVCTPEDAINCFLNCELDILVLGDVILTKTSEPAH